MALRSSRTGGTKVVKLTFGRSPSARRNPVDNLTYMDSDTLAVVRRLAKDQGQGKHIKLFYTGGWQRAYKEAEIAERGGARWGSQKSGDLEVFSMTDQKGVYGYAPAGLVEASLDAVEQIRAARAERAWQEGFAKTEAYKQKMAAQMEQLERKYGPQFAGLTDKFEKAVENYERLSGGGGSPAQIKEAKAAVAKTIAPAVRKKGSLKGAASVFMRTLMEVPGKENPGTVAKFLGMNDTDVRNAARLAKRFSIGIVSPIPGPWW